MINLITFYCDYCRKDWTITKREIDYDKDPITTPCKICETEYCGDCAEQHEEECK